MDYVANCRIAKPVELYDMIIGGIANDRVILTLDRYFAGELSKEQALGLLKYERNKMLKHKADLIDEGIADLHCRSDKYLATEIWNDYITQNHN